MFENNRKLSINIPDVISFFFSLFIQTSGDKVIYNALKYHAEGKRIRVPAKAKLLQTDLEEKALQFDYWWRTVKQSANDIRTLNHEHKMEIVTLEKYERQWGDLKVRYFINHLMSITSPFYRWISFCFCFC